MRLQSHRQYESTKFVALLDSEITTNRKKRRFLWVGIVLILILLGSSSVAYYYYKDFITPVGYNTSEVIITRPKSRLDLKPWILTEKQNPKKELTCKESQLQAIPLDFIEKNTQKTHLPLELLLYYENIINKHEVESLKLIFSEYQQKLTRIKTWDGLLNFIGSLDSNKLKFYARYMKGENFNLELNDFRYYFDLTDELNRWYNYLSGLRFYLSQYEIQKKRGNYPRKITEINFNKFTKETQEVLFRSSYPFNMTEKKLEEVNGVVGEWMSPFKVEENGSLVIFFNNVLILSEVGDKLNSLDLTRVKNVFIFASRIIYMDGDLTLHGVNVAIISPSWVFLKKIKIDLNGAPGEEHDSNVAENGMPGRPGNPGGNAGDFLGVGDINEKFLLVYGNGGRGGGGQNGAKGQPGMSFTRPDPPINKPTCVFKLSSFKNSFNQIITHYKIFGGAGCGGSGTDGGVGGQGGRAGRITLMIGSELKMRNGVDGGTGSPGKGGEGGAGGRNGCFYEALDVDDEVLHCVTTVKCPGGETLPEGEPGKDNENKQKQLLPPLKENLTIFDPLYHFIRLTGSDYTLNDKNKYHPITSFFKLYRETTAEPIIKLFNLLESLDNINLYHLFREHIQKEPRHNSSALSDLNSLTLGRILILKKSSRYFFVDFNNYLSIIKKSIRETSEKTREFPAAEHLKQRVGVKLDVINNNLKDTRRKLNELIEDNNKLIMKLLEEVSISQDYVKLSEALQETRVSCIMLTGLEIADGVLEETHLVNSFCSMPFDVLRDGLMDGLMDGNEKYNEILTAVSTFSPNIHNEMRMFGGFKNILNKNIQKEHLNEVKDGLDSLKEGAMLSEERKIMLEALTDEIKHLLTLVDFIEWGSLENSFRKSLNESWTKELSKNKLIEVMIKLQYKLAVDAARQRLYPFVKLDSKLQQHNKTLAEEALEEINNLRDIERGNSFCRNNLEGVFDGSSSIGEFYHWTNSEIRRELKDLFGGGEINLKANLINHHVLDKNYIKFTSIRFEFESREGNLRNVLNDFKIEVTHSGYSHYNWRGETHIMVSEEITFGYSLKTRSNGEPEFYNSLFKKCQNGEIMLSPYTTWRIRLLPVKSGVDYDKLLPFVDKVDIRLIGTGSFVS